MKSIKVVRTFLLVFCLVIAIISQFIVTINYKGDLVNFVYAVPTLESVLHYKYIFANSIILLLYAFFGFICLFLKENKKIVIFFASFFGVAAILSGVVGLVLKPIDLVNGFGNYNYRQVFLAAAGLTFGSLDYMLFVTSASISSVKDKYQSGVVTQNFIESQVDDSNSGFRSEMYSGKDLKSELKKIKDELLKPNDEFFDAISKTGALDDELNAYQNNKSKKATQFTRSKSAKESVPENIFDAFPKKNSKLLKQLEDKAKEEEFNQIKWIVKINQIVTLLSSSLMSFLSEKTSSLEDNINNKALLLRAENFNENFIIAKKNFLKLEDFISKEEFNSFFYKLVDIYSTSNTIISNDMKLIRVAFDDLSSTFDDIKKMTLKLEEKYPKLSTQLEGYKELSLDYGSSSGNTTDSKHSIV